MFNPTEVVIDAFEERLRDAYLSTYTNLEPSYPGIICFVSRMALEIIANSDAPYHDPRKIENHERAAASRSTIVPHRRPASRGWRLAARSETAPFPRKGPGRRLGREQDPQQIA